MNRETQLDELEALVVAVISQTRALRREGESAWQRCVGDLESEVAALAEQVGRMKESLASAPARGRMGDDWLPAATGH